VRFKGNEPFLCVGIALTLFGCGERSGGKGTPSGTPDGATDGSRLPDLAADSAGTDVPPASSYFLMIDDMDHADGRFPAVPPGSSSFFWPGPAGISGVHLGNWFLSSPAGLSHDAGIDDIVPPRGESKKACHVSGSNLDVGTDLWAQLDHPQNRPVELGAYAGIAFWARLNSPSSKLVVAIDDRFGGGFFRGEASQSPLPARTLTVSDQWERFELLFTDFGLATSAVVSIDFVVGRAGESFDLWIDDLALLCRGVCR